MKTHLLPLDPNDDLTSVRDKMAWGKTARILIIWPETDEPVLDRRLDIQIIRRRAEELGASLAFVTRDPEVKSHARELGIPVYRTSRDGQAAHWRFRRKKSLLEIIRRIRASEGPSFVLPATRFAPHRPSNRLLDSPFTRLIFFILALLSVGVLTGLLFPRATIVLTPAAQTQTIPFTAFTGPTITTVNATGAIPARALTAIVEGRTTVPSTGTLNLPKNPASGRVTFTNLTDVAVIIPAGTVVLTAEMIRFTTDRQSQVPAQVGGTVDVPITATQPGAQGNIPNNAIQSIEGTLGLQLTVSNAVRTAGGTSQTLAAPTELDRQTAYQQLFTSLLETATTEILAQLTPGDLLLHATPVLLQTLEETYTPADPISGALPIPADFLEVALRLEFQALAITQADLQTLSQTVLDAGSEMGYEPVPNTLTFELLSTPILDEENTAQWEMKAEQRLTAILPGNTAVALALGQPPASVPPRLVAALPLAVPPDIQLTPAWWPWMPFLPYQIEITGTH